MERDVSHSLRSNATIFINESIEIADLKIWGSPVTPTADTAFGMPSAADRCRLFSPIPDDTVGGLLPKLEVLRMRRPRLGIEPIVTPDL